MDIQLPYKPRAWQKIVHASTAQFKVAVVHRRGGKSVMAVMECLMAGLKSLGNPDLHSPKILYVAPTHGMAKQIAWDELKKATLGWPESKTVKKNYQNTDLIFTYGTETNSFTVNLKGAEKPDNLRGMGTLYIVLDEYQDMKADTWTKVLYPTTLDYPEAKVMFIGTPKGKNKLFQVFKGCDDKKRWESFYFPITTTGLFPYEADLEHSEEWYEKNNKIKPVTIEDIKRETTDDFGPEAYEQEFMCSWSPTTKGAIYRDQMLHVRESGRLGEVPVTNRAPVNTAWDLGYGDSMAIVCFQQIGNEIRIVKYIHGQGRGMIEYFDELNEWKARHGVAWGYHIAPHDIEHHDVVTGKTRRDTCAEYGFYFDTIIPNYAGCITDRIEATRKMLPTCHFDSDNTVDLIEALSMYFYEYDAKNDVFKKTPKHDKFSHGADAFGYMAMGIREHQNEEIQAIDGGWNGDPFAC